MLLDHAAVWISLYFLTNLGLTLYNKAVFQFAHFPYPFCLTLVHCLFSCLGSAVYLLVRRGSLTLPLSCRAWVVLAAFSVLYTVNISVSNVSLELVSLAFHQVVRSTTPVFVVALSLLWWRKRYSPATYATLAPVVLGVSLATYGEMQFTLLGFVLTVFGTFLAALKTVVTNVVLVGDLKMDPVDLLFRMSFLALFETLAFAAYNDEVEGALRLLRDDDNARVLALVLSTNGLLAFALNVVSFTANKKTSALSMTVAANVKQVLIIVLAVIVFSTPLTIANTSGMIITVIGGIAYTMAEYREKMESSRKPTSAV